MKYLNFFLPIVLLIIIYNTQYLYADIIRSNYILVSEPYLLDKLLFGIQLGSNILTPSEFLQQHTHWILDFICGFFYISYIPLFVSISAYFTFWNKQKDSWQIMWSWLFLNVIGFSTYYWLPAAPPWYTTLYGTDLPANLAVSANVAGCERFDKLIGIGVFKWFYGNSQDVFGSIPSLHVAYPFLSMLYAIKFRSLIFTNLLFTLIMSFAAVYLNHHYVIDVLLGFVYSVFSYLAFSTKKQS